MNDKKMTTEKIDNFIGIFNDFKHLQQQQKMRGLNDFNIFTTLLKQHDEVRLHSRFLAFLLSPNKNHYQGDLFLGLFLNECGIKDFFTDLNACEVYCEYKNIDIYITDGNKHIIIENKIWAGDQHAQIKRYIETINKENEGLTSDDLVAVYLSMNRKKPSNYSLCEKEFEQDEPNDEKNCPDGFYVENKKIIGRGKNKDRKYQFINLNYNNQITKWLKKSHQQIANITNLSEGISQYQEVIEKLYGTYKEKVMDLNEYLKNKDNKKELLKDMQEISGAYEKYRKQAIQKFFKSSILKLQEKVVDGWEVVGGYDKDNNYSPLKIRQSENSKVLFHFAFDYVNFLSSYFGVSRLDETVDFNKLRIDDNIKKMLEEKKIIKPKNSKWHLDWVWHYKGDIFDKIIEEGEAVDKFVDRLVQEFKKYKDVIVKCNEILDNKK